MELWDGSGSVKNGQRFDMGKGTVISVSGVKVRAILRATVYKTMKLR